MHRNSSGKPLETTQRPFLKLVKTPGETSLQEKICGPFESHAEMIEWLERHRWFVTATKETRADVYNTLADLGFELTSEELDEYARETGKLQLAKLINERCHPENHPLMEKFAVNYEAAIQSFQTEGTYYPSIRAVDGKLYFVPTFAEILSVSSTFMDDCADMISPKLCIIPDPQLTPRNIGSGISAFPGWHIWIEEES